MVTQHPHEVSKKVWPPATAKLFQLIVFEAAFYFAYKCGMSFSQAAPSPFWFADSVLLCAFLLTPPKRWWLFAFATLPVRLSVALPPATPLWFMLAAFAIDVAKGLLTAALLRTSLKNPLRIESVKEFSLFCLFAVLLVPAASAFGGAAARSALGYPYWSSWKQWFSGDALTQLVITPAILYWICGLPEILASISIRRALEGAALTIGLLVAEYIAFGMPIAEIGLVEARFYAPVPFLFWAAVRFGMLGSSGAITILAFSSAYAAVHGIGPFSGASPTRTAVILQRFLFVRAAPLYLVAVLIEQMKRVENSLRESEERMSLAARAAGLGMWLWDVTRDSVWATPEIRSLFGWAPVESVNFERFLSSVHADDREATRLSVIRSLQDGADLVIEYRVLSEGGKVRWVALRGRAEFNDAGSPTRLRGVAIDITERKMADLALRHYREELAHVARIAAMGELTASLAHEISQPLTAILNNTKAALRFLAVKRPNLDEVKGILKDIVSDDTRAGEVIRRLRSLIKKERLTFAPVDVGVVINEVLALLRSDAVRRHVQMFPEFNGLLPPVMGDKIQLQQVVMNLLLNAFEAMAPCSEYDRHVLIAAHHNDAGMVEISVRDSGTGLTPEQLEKVFEPFFTTKREGLGVGLSISRSIIEAHGGRLWARNNPDRGATFFFTLPVVSTDDAGPKTPEAPRSIPQAAPSRIHTSALS